MIVTLPKIADIVRIRAEQHIKELFDVFPLEVNGLKFSRIDIVAITRPDESTPEEKVRILITLRPEAERSGINTHATDEIADLLPAHYKNKDEA